MRRREAVLDVYKLALGAFLFVSPWLFAFGREAARIDSWAVGAALVVLSLATLVLFSEWEEWASLLLAVWLIVSPWLFGFTHLRAMHFSIGIGTVILFLTLLEIWLIHYDQPDHEVAHAREVDHQRWMP